MRIYPNRISMLYEFPLNSKIAELGVYKGEFSEVLLNNCVPKELVLIDLWDAESHIASADADGNNLEHIKGSDLCAEVMNKFFDKKNVVVIKGFTDEILKYPNDYFDVIYIDADHSYAGCKNDLKNAFQKIRNGGIISGHDYEWNFEKAKSYYEFGVKQAVDEFCEEYKQQIAFKAMDGCVSFGIIIAK